MSSEARRGSGSLESTIDANRKIGFPGQTLGGRGTRDQQPACHHFDRKADSAGRCRDVENMNPEFKAQLMESLSQVDTQIQRCKRITHNLLRFSRRTQSTIAPVDLNAFIGEIIDLMERDARTSGIKFVSDFQEDLPTLSSDSSQLQQVFLNMITNAIDAHAGVPYGTIRITTGRMMKKRESMLYLPIVVPGSLRKSWTRYSIRFSHQGGGQRNRPGSLHLLQHCQTVGR